MVVWIESPVVVLGMHFYIWSSLTIELEVHDCSDCVIQVGPGVVDRRSVDGGGGCRIVTQPVYRPQPEPSAVNVTVRQAHEVHCDAVFHAAIYRVIADGLICTAPCAGADDGVDRCQRTALACHPVRR